MALTIAEAYSNLNIVLDNLRKQSAENELIESVVLAQKSLLAIEMIGIASQKEHSLNKINEN